MAIFDLITKPVMNYISKRLNVTPQSKFMNSAEQATEQLRPATFNNRLNSNLERYKYSYAVENLYWISYNSDVLSTIQNALKGEIFRNGYEIVEAKDTDSDTTTDEDVYVATPEDKQRLKLFLNNCNTNGQTLLDVSMQLEDDINIVDDCFLLFIKMYGYDSKGDIIPEKSEVKEILRVDPGFVKLMMDHQDRLGYDEEGTEIKVCPEHRDSIIKNADYCSICGKKAYNVWYEYNANGKLVYYLKDEIVHCSRYRPSRRLGYAPVLTVIQKVMTLMSQDFYIKQVYEGQRPPKGLLVFNTSNLDSLQKQWKVMLEQTRANPQMPGLMAVENGSSGSKKVGEYFDFMRSLVDLQYTEQRDEYRKQIGAVYGVTPIWQGDMSQGGGLNNEGLQITISNRAAERAQVMYNDKIYPKILEALNIQGLNIRLRPSEEQDEMAKLQRQNQAILNGKLAVEAGLVARYIKDKDEVLIEDGDIIKPDYSGMSSFGEEEPDIPESTASTSAKPVKPLQAIKSNPKKNSSKYINEITKVDPKRIPFTEFNKILSKELNIYLKKLKAKPSPAELLKIREGIKDRLYLDIKAKSDEYIDKEYKKGMYQAEKDLDINVEFGQRDEQAILTLQNQKVLTDSYNNITDNLSKGVNDIIVEAFSNPKENTAYKLTEKIKELTNISDQRAEMIARTESSKVNFASRRNSYIKEDPNNEFIYKWIGPTDNRTTRACKNIMRKTRNGVSWENLVAIIKEESAKEFPTWIVDDLFPVAHFSCRHNFVRVVK